VEQNVGIIIVNVPAIRPLFARAFAVNKKSSGTGSRYNAGASYKMNDLSGHSNSHGFRSVVVARKGVSELDPSGSESSLVGKNLDHGITKTVGVSVDSYHPGQDLGVGGPGGHGNMV
jgi:hypothetical protein